MKNNRIVSRKQQEKQGDNCTRLGEVENNIDKYKRLFKIYKRYFKLTKNAKNIDLYNELFFLLRERSQYYNTIKVINPLKDIKRRMLLSEAHRQAMLLCYVSYEREDKSTVKAWYDLIYNDKNYLSKQYINAKDLLVCLTFVFMQQMGSIFTSVIDELVELYCPYIPEKDSDYYSFNEFIKGHKDDKYRIKSWELRAVSLKLWQSKSLSFKDWCLFTNDFCKESTIYLLLMIYNHNPDVDLHAIVDIMENHLTNKDNIVPNREWNEPHEVLEYFHDYIDEHILKMNRQIFKGEKHLKNNSAKSKYQTKENESKKRKSGRKPGCLFENGNKDVYVKLFTNYLKEYKRFSTIIDTTKTNYINKAFCVFYREWKKQGIVHSQPNGNACYQFLQEDCALQMKAEKKTYANHIRNMINGANELDLIDIELNVRTFLNTHKQ